MAANIPTSVFAQRRIAASTSTVFSFLATPARHLDMDGSTMLRGSDSKPVTGVGDVFVMRMYYEPLGHYEMNNHVVEFVRDRRIVWEPEDGKGHPQEGTPGARWGHRWGFELVPAGPDDSIVTEFWDCSRVPADEREDGRRWLPSMERTLERLEELLTGRRLQSR